MTNRLNRLAAPALATVLGLALAGCQTAGGSPPNRSLYSIHQPVVERTNYTLDLAAGPNGLDVSERARLADWFDALAIGYGDRIAIEDGLGRASVREDVAALAGRRGLLLADTAPVTQGFLAPGAVRVVVTRSRAHVPGCPDWSDNGRTALSNATSAGFGCAINGNLAAMVADPEHLLEGARGTGETVVMTSNRAINSYRTAEPTGAAGLPQTSTQEGN